MKIFISLAVACVVTFATATPTSYIVTNIELLGTNECTYGPSYWCRNITQASECSAVQHCITRQWTSMKLEPDNDSVCQICKDMVQQARDQLLSNETQTELRQVLEGSCDLIPLKIISTECKKLADDFIPELTDMLVSRMDPQQVCSISGLCNSPRIDRLLEKTSTCENFINKNKERVKDVLIEYCGKYAGSYSDSCRAIILEEFDKLNLEEICDLLPEKLSTKNIDPDLECQFCEDLIDSLRSFLTQNTTREEFDTMLTNMCKQTGKYAAECDSIIKQYGTEIYQLIIDELDSESFCGRLGLCNDTYADKNDIDSHPVWTILSRSDEIDDDFVMAPLLPASSVQSPSQKDVLPTCAICEFSVTKLINLIGKNHTKESIEAATKKACSELPSQYIEKCQTFMEEYGDRVIEMILIEGSSHEICAALHLCFFEYNEETPIGVDATSTVELYDDKTCILCEYVIQFLAEKIKDNATEAEIKQEVLSICTKFPKTVQANCKAFVTIYGDEVIAYLVSEMDPEQICQELKLCKKPKDRCNLCKQFNTFVQEKKQKDKWTEDTILKFCPSENSDDSCNSFVDDYGAYYLVSDADGDQDPCEVIGAC